MAKELEAYIECPFYVGYGKNYISCEGICSTGKTTHFFNDKVELKHQLLNLCGKNGGKKCPHFRAVSLLYERGLRS